VMSDGGTLLFNTPHRGLFWWMDPLMAKTLLRRAGKLGRGPGLKGHKHYRVEEVAGLLEPHFEILQVERRAALLHPLAYWSHLVTARVGGPAELMRLWPALIDADYSHEYGDAAYTVCLVARAR